MCCILTILVVLGPRVAGAIWWIARPTYWQAAASNWIWPLLGLIFIPWTTIMYLLVYPRGLTGFEWFMIALAVIADIGSYTGGAYGNRDRIPGYGSSSSS